MEQLGSAEPMLCQYEMKYLVDEIENMTSLVACVSSEELRESFLKNSRAS